MPRLKYQQVKKDGRVLEMFKLETKDDTEAEALITENLTCPITGVIYRVEEFRIPISVQQCWNCQSFGHSAKTCRSKTKCLICGESHHHKGCQNNEKSSQNAPIVKDHMLHPTKGVQHTKNRHLDNMWWIAKNHMPQFAKLGSPQPQDKTITFSGEQPVKFEANMGIQVAQPQVCCANPAQDAIDKKSSLCRRVFEATKNHLDVDITGISLFDAAGQPPAPSASKSKTSLAKGESPFKFNSSTKVIKPSAILKSLSPQSPNSLNPINRIP